MRTNEFTANRGLALAAKMPRAPYSNLQPYAHLRHVKQPLTLQTWAKRNIPTLLKLVGA